MWAIKWEKESEDRTFMESVGGGRPEPAYEACRPCLGISGPADEEPREDCS